jgi:PleD family two-component response regulator
MVRRPLDAERLGPILMAAAALSHDRAKLVQAQGAEQMLRSRLERRDDTATGFQTLDQWKRVLEVELKRARRYGYALSVCNLAMVPAPPPAIANDLRVRVAAAVRAAIRDIDFPVELTDDRFLVLLPYTDVAGAEHVAHRIVAAVREAPGVRSAGRTWTTSVVAGVAGVTAGGPVSMAQLMRDAGQAVLAAKKRGVDVVVA